MYVARVYVTLKPTVNDPQGLTIRGALHSLGFADVESVRAGKYLEVHLDANDRKKAEKQLSEIRSGVLRFYLADYTAELGHRFQSGEMRLLDFTTTVAVAETP